jgi:predicted ATP-dependent endonuclease of OLD family
MLRDLTIQNYRCFKDFHIDGLARVNLIVGMNNIGKTSLLEAVYLLVNQENIQCLIDLIHNRGEIAKQSISLMPGETQQRTDGYQVKHIFYDHQLNPSQIISLQSQKDNPLSLRIRFSSYKQRVSAPTPTPTPGIMTLKESLPVESMETDQIGFMLFYSYERNESYVTGIPTREDGLIPAQFYQSWKQNQQFYQSWKQNQLNTFHIPNYFLPTSNLSFEELARFWNGIILTSKEDRVVEALQIIEPDVERIGFTSHQTPNSGILLKVRGQSEPIPLGTMGEGMRRILTLAMAAVTVEKGFLLVDEIETGLYYESQTDMWRLILEIAQQLDVQVFATTHSWDCIAAFQEALDQIEDSSVGKLFRLSRKGENIRAIDYPSEKLGVAVRQNIEVR